MFSAIEKNGTAEILWNGAPLLTGLCPVVRLDDGTCPALTLQTRELETDHASLTWADETITAGLTLSWEEDCLLLRMEGQITYETAYPVAAFAEQNGLGLRVETLHSDGNLLTFYHFNRWWTRSHICQAPEELKPATSACVGRCGDAYYHLQMLADGGLTARLEPSESGAVLWLGGGTAGETCCSAAACSLVLDPAFDVLSEKTVRWLQKTIHTPCRPASEKKLPEMFEYLGWCSWNAFYDKVSAAGVLEKAEECRAAGLPLRWVLLDHGWSTEENQALVDFAEDPVKFPEGLEGLKHRLETLGVDWLGVWQGFCGHWGTIDPAGPVAKTMAPNLVRTPGGKVIPRPTLTDTFTFWDTWHRALKQKGVDFVKVDIQSSLPVFARGILPGETAAKAAHRGLEASVGVNFDGNLLNCMGMGMEAVLSRPMSALSRSSDDFFPHKDNSFVQHALDNAYNAVWHSGFYHGDWDMWWTIHPEAKNNQYLRAISGGPVYTSDCVGETDPAMLWPLILSDGRILRCDRSGMVAEDQLLQDVRQGGALKIQNHIGSTGFVACFAVCDAGDKQVRTVEVSPLDVPELKRLSAEAYLALRVSDGVVRKVKKQEKLTVSVSAGMPEMIQFTPCRNRVTLLGDLGKCLPGAILRECVRDGNRMLVRLREGGRICWWSETSGTVLVKGRKEPVRLVPGIGTLELAPAETMLEFSWEELRTEGV